MDPRSLPGCRAHIGSDSSEIAAALFRFPSRRKIGGRDDAAGGNVPLAVTSDEEVRPMYVVSTWVLPRSVTAARLS